MGSSTVHKPDIDLMHWTWPRAQYTRKHLELREKTVNKNPSEQSMSSNDCTVCLDGFTDPRSMPCGHTFCQGCIQRMAHGTRVDCPIDRRSFNIPNGGFTRNYALQDVLQQHPNVPQQPTRVTPSAPRPPTRPTEQNATNYEIYYVNVAGDHTSDRNHPRTNTRTQSERQMRTTALVVTLICITFSRFIAGAVKLSSDCSMEKDVAVYLFVKSWFGFLFWSIIMGLVIKEKISRALKNLFYEIFLFATTSFAFIWLLIGSVWVFGNHQKMRMDCPLETGSNSWTADFINFAIFLTVLDWACVTVFLFFFLYLICEDDGGDGDD